MTRFAAYAPDSASRPRVAALVIRQAARGDVDAVAALVVARNGGSIEERRARLARELDRTKRRRLFVAEIAGRVVGYGWVTRLSTPADAPAGSPPAGWYLLGVVVAPDWRRRGVGTALTRARLAFIAERTTEAYYVASAANHASIDLHVPFGFTEVTRDFVFPRIRFEGGTGVLFRVELARA